MTTARVIRRVNSTINPASFEPNLTPQSAYTQTFSTADKTHATRTSSAVDTTAAAALSFGYTEAQANALVAAVNAIRADLADTAAVVNAIIDDLQALGLSAAP